MAVKKKKEEEEGEEGYEVKEKSRDEENVVSERRHWR